MAGQFDVVAVQYSLIDAFTPGAVRATAAAGRFGAVASASSVAAGALSRGMALVGANSTIAAAGVGRLNMALGLLTGTGGALLLALAGIGAVIGGLTLAFGTMIRVVRRAVETSSEFHETMLKTVTLADLSEEEMTKFSKAIIETAPKVGVSAREMAEAFFFVTSAGITGAKAMETVELAAKASRAGLGSMSVIVQSLTTALLAYADAGLTAQDAMDILLQGVRVAKVEADEFAPALGRMVAIAAAMKVPFDQVILTFGLLTRVMGSAEESATAMRGILSQLLKPTEESKKVLGEFGLTFEDLRRGIQTDFIGTLRKLWATLGENEVAFTEIFPDVRGLTGALSLLKQDTEAVNEAMEVMRNRTGALEQSFSKTTGTLSFQIAKIRAQFEGMLIRIGERIMPAFVGLFEELNKQVEEFAKSPEFDAIVKAFSDLVRDVVGQFMDWVKSGGLRKFLEELPGMIRTIADAMVIISRVLLGIMDIIVRISGAIDRVRTGFSAGAHMFTAPPGGFGGAVAADIGQRFFMESFMKPKPATTDPLQASREMGEKMVRVRQEEKEMEKMNANALNRTADNTEKIARQMQTLIDIQRFALGGGNIGRIGITPVEMRDIRQGRLPVVKITGGSDLERAIANMFGQFLVQLRRQGAI